MRKKSIGRTRSGAVPPYGPPIHDAIARGDLREMRALSLSTRKWVANVSAALRDLEKAIRGLERKGA